MATVEIAKVAGSTSPVNATVQIARVSAVAATSTPARVELAQVAAFIKAAVGGGTSLLVQYTEQGWQRITGQLVRWNGTTWAEAGSNQSTTPTTPEPAPTYGSGVYGAGVYGN